MEQLAKMTEAITHSMIRLPVLFRLWNLWKRICFATGCNDLAAGTNGGRTLGLSAVFRCLKQLLGYIVNRRTVFMRFG